MFVLCPHCQFLVTVDPRTGAPPATCPKCGKSMDDTQDAPPAVEVVAEPAPAMETTPAVEPAPEPEPAPTPARDPDPPRAPAQLSADDVIAAMAQKSPRRPRTKSRAEPAAPPPSPKRKRTHAEPAGTPSADGAPAATDVPPPLPTPPPPPSAPKVQRPPGPSLSTRMSAWWKSMQPKAKANVAKPAVPPAKAEPEPGRRKATVKPVPSLRDRAAKRAADASEAASAAAAADTASTSAPVAPAPVAPAEPMRAEIPSTEFIPLAQTPVEVALAVEALVATPVVPDVAPDVAQPATPTVTIEPPTPVVASPPPSLPRRPATVAPSFARKRGAPGVAMPARWSSFATIGGLSLLLALQLLLAQRDALAAEARWRPTMSALCTVLRCTLPAWREPEAFTMLSRDVRPHPQAAGTLQIDASFRNDARWPQAWPRLVVSLSDVDGRVLGTRAFSAHEYLGDAADTQSALAPGQTAAIRLAVVEPAPGVVAFSFEFR